MDIFSGLTDYLGLIIMLIFGYFFLKLAMNTIQKVKVNLGPQYKKVDLDPTSTGERLKQYIIQAVKFNPKTANKLYLERTNWSEGGRIGNVIGHLTDKDCTAFIIKNRTFSRKKQLLYCPVDMHTSLHQKTVIIRAASLHSAGGYLWPVPKDDRSTHVVFKIVASAFEKDLKRMQKMDMPQIEIEQIYEGMTGFDRDETFYDEPSDIDERATLERVTEDDTDAYDKY